MTLRPITKGTGAWTDTNQEGENLRTPARQKPKGRFKIKVRKKATQNAADENKG
jgi:hypothetical protein